MPDIVERGPAARSTRADLYGEERDETCVVSKLPVDVVSEVPGGDQPVYVLSFLSSAVVSVDHDALWLALVIEVHQTSTHAPICSVTEYDGHMDGSSRQQVAHSPFTFGREGYSSRCH